MRINPNALVIFNLSAFTCFNTGKNRFFSQSFDAGKAYCLQGLCLKLRHAIYGAKTK